MTNSSQQHRRGQRFEVRYYDVDGSKQRVTFPTYSSAKKFAETAVKELAANREHFVTLRGREAFDFQTAVETLVPLGLSISEAATLVASENFYPRGETARIRCALPSRRLEDVRGGVRVKPFINFMSDIERWRRAARMGNTYGSRAGRAGACLLGLLLCATRGWGAEPGPGLRVYGISGTGMVEASCEGERQELKPGQCLRGWTLMGTARGGGGKRLAVFEDFSRMDGRLVLVNEAGVAAELPKSLEPTFAEPGSLYRGHRLEEVLDSAHDLLGEELLAQPGDPDYREVAACLPPIAKMATCTFVGTHECVEKIGFAYGGRTPDFDPAVYVPAIEGIRKAGRVWDGLVGGWLPVVRFVYPEKAGDWSELVAYAPLRTDNGNSRLQPVWYRVCCVQSNVLRWVRYFDSYHPFPPRLDQGAEPFYEDLLEMRTGWERALEGGMELQIPDGRLRDMARHALVRAMMTRVGAFPKYGVVDRSYGGSEHDGFPDTFNVDASAMLEWGLFGRARDYLDNYFGAFVRDDGSLLYRGPETGQFGRMLTVCAEYANYTGDEELLLKHRRRIQAVADLLLSLREKALRLPATDAAHGMISGWCEADACLDPEPARYMQPYFSNSSEAARGFDELGAVWVRAGRRRNLPELVASGERLREAGRGLAADLQTCIRRSILTNASPPCVPAIAGAREPFDAAVARDRLDPQFRSYRAYMEMLYSGNLTRPEVEMVVRYRAAHHNTILGVPTAYGLERHELAGFLSYGHAYGLLQSDLVREYLLTLYSLMAHQYTRGTWTAPETRAINPERRVAPYCAPAELAVPLLTRWLLVFEEPGTNVLWLAKATPRAWLENGQVIGVSQAPTRWGRIGFKLSSQLGQNRVLGEVELPSGEASFQTRVRLRVPAGYRMKSVGLGGKPWNEFDPEQETVSLPAGASGRVSFTVDYQ